MTAIAEAPVIDAQSAWAHPLYDTPRTLSRPTVGAEVAAVGEQLGQPFMEWQRHVSDVAGELNEDGSFAYPVVILLVPRRAGKSFLAACTLLQRAQAQRNARCWITSQTAALARDLLKYEWIPMVESSELDKLTKNSLSNGSEAITFPGLNSRVSTFAPTRKGLHGQDGDTVVIDEGWAFNEADGLEIEAGVRPTMLTRRSRQLWIISAGGDGSSTWLYEWRKRGRALAGATDKGIAYFEWTAPHDEQGAPTVDLDSPATWAQVHPAVGSTINLEVLKADKESTSPAQFYRSILNVWDANQGAAKAIPAEDWKTCTDYHAQLGESGLHMAYDVAPDFKSASILFARKDEHGRIITELIANGPGIKWLSGRLAELFYKYRPTIVADDKGPVTTVTRELADIGITVKTLNYAEIADGTVELIESIKDHKLAHRAQPELDSAVTNAAVKTRDDGRILFKRDHASVDMTPLIALNIAAFSARHTVANKPTFMFSK